jgi:arylacetamide deacetylase-like 2
MGYKILCFGLFCILFAYYIYIPMPENIEERWKIQFLDAGVKMLSFMVIYFNIIFY